MLEFKSEYLLSLIFSDDLKYVYLTTNNIDVSYFKLCKDKLNGYIIKPNINEVHNVTITKDISEKFNLKVDPDHIRMVLNLQNLDKEWKFFVYMIILKEKNLSKNLEECLVYKLPDNCFPFIRWLVPLSIDVMVYGSNYNQIIVK